MTDYMNCLKQEAKKYGGEKLKSIYIGGGTPSHLKNELLEELSGMVHEVFQFDKNTELTLESNPEDIDESKARLLLSLGVNRLSMGVQSLNNKYLEVLGRCHNADTAVNAFHILRKTGFNNISVDLMYSFPGQSQLEIEEDVSKLIELRSEHVSLYTLSVEPHSRFYAQNLQEQEGRIQAQHYLNVKNLLEQAGFAQYEVSNFAKPGFESQHNINYWKGGDYIGLGVGAHSHVKGKRSWNVSKFSEYIKRIKNNEDVAEGREELGDEERLRETMLLELRMNQGTNLKRLENRFRCYLDENRIEKIHDLVEMGLLKQKGTQVTATDQGRLVLDDIAARLI